MWWIPLIITVIIALGFVLALCAAAAWADEARGYK